MPNSVCCLIKHNSVYKTTKHSVWHLVEVQQMLIPIMLSLALPFEMTM